MRSAEPPASSHARKTNCAASDRPCFSSHASTRGSTAAISVAVVAGSSLATAFEPRPIDEPRLGRELVLFEPRKHAPIDRGDLRCGRGRVEPRRSIEPRLINELRRLGEAVLFEPSKHARLTGAIFVAV